jgi:hypothetical protein
VEQLLWEVEGIGLGRCAVALGATSDGNEAVLVVESEGAQWLQEALGVMQSATDTDLHVEVVRVDRGGIPRTSSGKPRRRHIWTHVRNHQFPGERVHRSSAALPAATGA